MPWETPIPSVLRFEACERPVRGSCRALRGRRCSGGWCRRPSAELLVLRLLPLLPSQDTVPDSAAQVSRHGLIPRPLPGVPSAAALLQMSSHSLAGLE